MTYLGGISGSERFPAMERHSIVMGLGPRTVHTNQDKIKTEDFNFSIGRSKKWSLDESNLTDDLKYDLIKDGLAENNFKPFISEIKSKYKGKEIPDWVEILENEFLRVN